MAAYTQPSATEQELAIVERGEQDFLRRRAKKRESLISRTLEDRIPEKLRDTLKDAFGKAFSLIFGKGSDIIGLSLDKARRQEDYFADACALDAEKDSWALRRFSDTASKAGLGNKLISGALGVGLGLFGVGIPDIPVFTGLMLKSIYEIALSYGFDYESEDEKLFILKLIRTSVANGEEVWLMDGDLNRFISSSQWPEGTTLEDEERETAAALTEELLYLKFLQSLPAVGVLGGLSDPIYISRISSYADLKYHRRFLMSLKG